MSLRPRAQLSVMMQHNGWHPWACDLQVYGVAKYCQQLVIHHDGPAVFAMFISVRVVAAIVGSWALLGEGIGSWLEATGCLIVILSISWYLWVQWQTREEVESV